MVTFNPNDDPEEVLQRAASERTCLTAFFEANADNGALGREARKYTYQEFPQHFTWQNDKDKKYWLIHGICCNGFALSLSISPMLQEFTCWRSQLDALLFEYPAPENSEQPLMKPSDFLEMEFQKVRRCRCKLQPSVARQPKLNLLHLDDMAEEQYSMIQRASDSQRHY